MEVYGTCPKFSSFSAQLMEVKLDSGKKLDLLKRQREYTMEQLNLVKNSLNKTISSLELAIKGDKGDIESPKSQNIEPLDKN